MRTYQLDKNYYISYIMRKKEFDLTKIDLAGVKLRIWHSLLVYNGGLCLIPGVYYFDKDMHLNEMCYMACIFEENLNTNHTNYLSDECLIKMHDYAIFIDEHNREGLINAYQTFERIRAVLCLNLNVQIIK